MISDDEAGHQVSYWPSVSDLFMTLFITAIALVAVVLFLFLVNPGEAVFKGQIIELRNLLGMPPLPAENDEQYRRAFGDTIRRAIAEIKACQETQQNVNALATCKTENQRLAEENRELSTRLSAVTQERDRLTAKLEKSKREVERITAELEELRRKIGDLTGPAGGLNDKPPIITIASDVLFPSGGITVATAANDSLWAGGFKDITQEILKRNANGQRMVDTLEIIGHTDSMPMKEKRGNLDAGLPQVLAGAAPIAGLKPGSNNDLGLLRALAIKQAWQAFVAQHPDRAALEQIQVRTYSAGQTIPVHPDGPVDDADARRIEMRLTKLGDPSAADAASRDR